MVASQCESLETSDTLLGEVMGAVFDRLAAGETPDLEAYVRQYPSIADLLRQALPPLMAISNIFQGTRTHDASVDPARQERLGDFRILREIGRGGMGVVYEAEQLSMGRSVALKVLPFAAMLDPKALRRFQNEVRAAATLDHPNIVPVYSTGCDRGVHYYAMHYIEGETLSGVIGRMAAAAQTPHAETEVADSTNTGLTAETTSLRSRTGREYFRVVARLGRDVAERLITRTNMDIVHRDIKPSNLLLDADGKIWVTDLGLAQIGTDANLTVTGDLLGTLRYMSPEQIHAHRAVVDHRTDIYSLGATLYELLTLRAAFDGNDRQRLLSQITAEEPRPPRRLNRSIPTELETIVLKATAKDVAGRYTTAQAMADDLNRFLEYRPVLARRHPW